MCSYMCCSVLVYGYGKVIVVYVSPSISTWPDREMTLNSTGLILHLGVEHTPLNRQHPGSR